MTENRELLGREREQSELLAALENAAHGDGGTVLLAGEAGVGKTRLADELLPLLTSRIRKERVLILATYRSDEIPRAHRLRWARHELRRSRHLPHEDTVSNRYCLS